MPNRITGTSGSDRLIGRNDLNDFDFIKGLAGDDVIIGLGGRDLLDGGAGNDRFEYLNRLVDIDIGESIIGGDGLDTIVFTGSKNLGNLFSIESIEALEFRGISTTVNFLTVFGSQIGNGLSAASQIKGSAGLDMLNIRMDEPGSINLMQFSFSGWSASDVVRVIGSAGADDMVGTNQTDILNGLAGADRMYGNLGNDTYYVNSALDAVYEGVNSGENDQVIASVTIAALWGNVETATLTGTAAINAFGNQLDNALTGNAAGNRISGYSGFDRLVGGGGGDELNGGADSDLLVGGAGNDRLIGGAGRDSFFLTERLDGMRNVDRISDFETGVDVIYLNAAWMPALASGMPLAASAFKVLNGAARLDADDRIIFDSVTNVLSYDRDGSGAAAAVRFAIIENERAIAATDFFIL